MSTFTPITLDSSLLLNYYSAQLSSAAAASSSSSSSSTSSSSSSSGSSFGEATTTSTANEPPWETQQTQTVQQEAASVLGITNFIPTTTTPLTATSGTSKSTAEDNQNLFTLYQAVNQLSELANVATQSGVTSGELSAYNTQFQTGLQQVENYINSTTFNNITVQAQTPSSSVTGTAGVALPSFDFAGNTIVSDADYNDALPNVSASDQFTIAVAKGGTNTNVNIDLSQIQGPLTITNIVNYVNQQLSADGFKSTFSVNMTSGSISDAQDSSYGISINPAPGETLTLSSSQATPALYLAGTTGSTTGTPADSATNTAAVPANNQGNITALTNLSTNPTPLFNATEAPSTGTTTAQQTVVDSQGNVYVVGDATGNMGSQLNQGSQDVYLSKYDSDGTLEWSQLLGSAGTANAYSLALNPSTGGVVVAGSTTAALSTTAVSNGNSDSFVASYDQNGNQLWETQIPTLNNNQANAVTVDSQGNVYIGGSVSGSLGAGQTGAGGTNAYLAEVNSSGDIVSENEYGAAGSDQVSAMTTESDGSVLVASQQNGEAYLTKYANGDTSGTPVWQMDLGSLNGGSISGIAQSNGQIYVSGTTSNTNLTAGGQATVAQAGTGGTQAFVFNATDNGTSATANTVSYVGATGGSTSGGSVTVGPDGTVYLAGTTTGTFAGQTRSVQGVNNAFVTALSSDGTTDWTRQFGGSDGESTGTSVAVDATGSSVLNALGLPSGTIDVNPSVDLTSDTTLRAGDSFQIQTEGTGGRTSTITISQGETLQQLADSINAELLSSGKASVTYSAAGGQALKITANAGNTINLIAGPTDTDALGRLGITAGVITAAAKTSSSSSTSSSATGKSFGVSLSSNSSSSSSGTTKPVYGLGLDTSIDLLSSSDANVAKISLENVMLQITSIYQKTNTTSSSSSSTSSSSSASSGPAPAYLTAQVANYSLALAAFSATNSLTSSSSSTSSTSIGLSSSLLQSVLTA